MNEYYSTELAPDMEEEADVITVPKSMDWLKSPFSVR